MNNDSQRIVAKAWNFAHVLRDAGLSYMAYTEQITFLLFLKMADELTKPPHNRASVVPKPYDWATLIAKEGEDLERQYRHTLEELGKRSCRSGGGRGGTSGGRWTWNAIRAAVENARKGFPPDAAASRPFTELP